MHFEIIDILVPALFIILFFWLLFVEKTWPGEGWFGFSIKDVDIKIRMLSFVLWIGAMFCAFSDRRLVAFILGGFAWWLLVFYE